MPSMRRLVLSVLALVMLRRAASNPALRGTLDPQRAQQHELEPVEDIQGEKTSNMDAGALDPQRDQQRVSDGVDNTDNMDADVTITGRGLQQTNIQSFIDSYQNGSTSNMTDTDATTTGQGLQQTNIQYFIGTYQNGSTSNVADTDATTTGRGLQQTNIQSFIDSYQNGSTGNDTTPTGVTGPVTHQPQNQPQAATSPNVGGGPGVVFGEGAQPGAPGIAGTKPLTLGGPSGLEAGGAGIGSGRAFEEMEVAEDTHAEGALDSNTTKRELQQTTLQAFINSFEQGTRFNDTPPMGVTGPTTHQPQIAHSPGVGGGPGIVFGGGAQPGAPGIAGGILPGLAGQPGVRAGGAGIGASLTGLGTTAGSIGGAPGGAGFIGPSGLPAPVAAQGGVGSSGGLGSVGGGGGAAGGI